MLRQPSLVAGENKTGFTFTVHFGIVVKADSSLHPNNYVLTLLDTDIKYNLFPVHLYHR